LKVSGSNDRTIQLFESYYCTSRTTVQKMSVSAQALPTQGCVKVVTAASNDANDAKNPRRNSRHSHHSMQEFDLMLDFDVALTRLD